MICYTSQSDLTLDYPVDICAISNPTNGVALLRPDGSVCEFTPDWAGDYWRHDKLPRGYKYAPAVHGWNKYARKYDTALL